MIEDTIWLVVVGSELLHGLAEAAVLAEDVAVAGPVGREEAGGGLGVHHGSISEKKI